MLGERRNETAPRGSWTRRYDRRAAGFIVLAAVGGFLALCVLAVLVGGDTFQSMTRDPLAVARAGDDVTPVAIGWLSHLGILVWTLAAGASLLAGVAATSVGRADRGFLVTAGLLSLGLVVDDLYQMHESVVPRLSRFTEEHVMLGWFLLTLAWVVVFRRVLLVSPYAPVLLVAAGFLAMSVASDAFSDIAPVQLLIGFVGEDAVLEEGAKLVGIVCWSAFLWLQSLRALRRPQPSGEVVGTLSRSDSHVAAG